MSVSDQLITALYNPAIYAHEVKKNQWVKESMGSDSIDSLNNK